MTIRRELEGIGYHYADSDDDSLLVDRWTRRPDELKGQSVTIVKLLPKDMRCPNNHISPYGNVDTNKSTPLKFRFRILIETEKIV